MPRFATSIGIAQSRRWELGRPDPARYPALKRNPLSAMERDSLKAGQTDSLGMRDDLIGEAIEVVRHDQHVANATAAILDVVRQNCLDPEAQALEGGARGNLIGGHHRGEFLE